MAKDKPPTKQQHTGDKKPDGTAAWHKLTQQTRPLSAGQRDRVRDKGGALRSDKRAGGKSAAASQKAGKAAASTPKDAPQSRPAGPAAKRTDTPRPPLAPRPEIEQKQRRRLSRGRLDLDGTLDLHGMTLAEAEAALTGFIAYHRAQGHRWVLVITGKGVRGEGRLRKALPDWLSAAPLSQAVAEFDHAAISHGGGGAFYLRLRRPARA